MKQISLRSIARDWRTALSLEERQEIERLLKKGYSGKAIGKLLQRSQSCIATEIRNNNGPQNYDAAAAQENANRKFAEGRQKSATAIRSRKQQNTNPRNCENYRKALTFEDRLTIEKMIKEHHNHKAIAEKTRRTRSAISQEIKRNGGYLNYSAEKAHQESVSRKESGKPIKSKYVSVFEKVAILQEQVTILTDMIKEIYARKNH